MKLAWLFGSTLEQRHLLLVYLSVWLIQGGYFTWLTTQWLRTKRNPPSTSVPSSQPSR